jgi:hypothetical protein
MAAYSRLFQDNTFFIVVEHTLVRYTETNKWYYIFKKNNQTDV